MKEIKVGIVGLGRLGSVHAQNLAFKIPGCKLVAACSLEQKELDWAKDYLKVEYTTTDYKKMVDEADIEAVVIVSSSPEHCWMIEYALDAGKHVFTDKPLGCSLEECKRAEAAVERHPDKIFFLGFMRRYDPSYADAKAQINAGRIGCLLYTSIERLPVSLILILSLRGRERKEKRPNQSVFYTVKTGISALGRRV